MAEYDLKINYNKGILYNNADALSRIEVDNNEQNSEECIKRKELIYHLLAILEKRGYTIVETISNK